MYGAKSLDGGKGTAVRGNVAVDNIMGREGQIFRTALEDKLNPEGLSTVNAKYHVAVSLTRSIIPAVVKSDGTIQRYDIRFDSAFKLFKAGAKASSFEGTLRRTGSYNVATNANFATYEAEQDVVERVLQEMSEDYVLRISGYLAGKYEP